MNVESEKGKVPSKNNFSEGIRKKNDRMCSRNSETSRFNRKS